ncbi:MAG: DUF1156 domain-containing protein [Rhodococcus qingshengii]
MINKALIELPATFRDQPPIFPDAATSEIRTWRGAEGLASDVRSYGHWMMTEAYTRLNHLYPDAVLDDGSQARPLAWLWARTIICSNPACGVEMPLLRSRWLSKKRGREVHVVPQVSPDQLHPSGKRIVFKLSSDPSTAPTKESDGTMSGRSGATCVACQGHTPINYIRSEGRAGNIGYTLLSTVVEHNRQRIYLPADELQTAAALIDRPEVTVDGAMADNPRWFSPPVYGLTEFSDLFTARQLVALTTLSDLVADVRTRVTHNGGSELYSKAISTYLAMAVSKMADYSNSLAVWYPQEDRPKNLFAAQAIPMVWDFPEQNPFTKIGGSFHACVRIVSEAFEALGRGPVAEVMQASAVDAAGMSGVMATDPPYYDNVGYSDLSDFFYVWLRRSLRDTYPELFSTMLVPKADELVANPVRHDGKEGAKAFFEDGFRRVFARAHANADPSIPTSVWYAFKQSESDARGEASTGWETLLEGMIRSGWEITSTWPVRSERGERRISIGTNALASSIVLTLRPRQSSAETIDRRGLIAALEAELPDALRKLQQGQVAPVDLPQAAIGPGMAVFSRYAAVLEPDGSKMAVRSALSRINEILDQVLNEQEGDFDPTSRFAIAWYRQYGYGVGKFGDADNIARARNTSLAAMDREEILTSRAGNVQLIKPGELSWDYEVLNDSHTSNWEVLHHLIKVLERNGIAAAGEFLLDALSRPDGVVDADLVKELAHLLFRIAEANGWTKDALSFNSLVTSWPEILEVAHTPRKTTAAQGAFDFEDDE